MYFMETFKLKIFKVLLMVLVCPVHSVIYYQHRFRPMPMYPPRPVRQTPQYYLNAQRYVAVPGRIVQHFNAATVPFTTAPALRPFPGLRNAPLVSPFLQTYYELESDPSSSSPNGENGGGLEPPPQEGGFEPPPQEGGFEPPPQEGGFEPPPQEGGFEPPPQEGGFEPPPQEGGLEPPPPESEPQEPPPMMGMRPPPPPPDMENDNNDNEQDQESPSKPPPPPPSHPHHKYVQKHISIHVPPDDLESENDQVTVIRPKNPGPSKHLNIIFVKAPSSKSRKEKTEVILPETPEQKTVVYVLVKRPDPANDGSIRVRGPAPTKPPKPQVYFIQYKQKDNSKRYVYSEKKRGSHHHHH